MRVATLTGNLLLEWTFDVESVKLGTTHRATSMSFQVGGKGINVARILNRLGVETESISFAEGTLAALSSDWLNRHQVCHRFLPLGEDARPGLVVRNRGDATTPETTFLGMDNPVPQASWKAACGHVASSCPDWLAICGSIPGWRTPWARDIKHLLGQESRPLVCVDTYGPPLEDLIQLPIDLVKINRMELQRLLAHPQDQPVHEVINDLRKDSPVQTWIITDGGNPITASLGDGRSYRVLPASIGEVSPTGSGDTFLAAILREWSLENAENMLAYAGACATANAASPGIGDFPLPVPERFQPGIEIL